MGVIAGLSLDRWVPGSSVSWLASLARMESRVLAALGTPTPPGWMAVLRG
jgi:hypothetical protein